MNLEDIALLKKPLKPISELKVFSSTFAGGFSNLHSRFEQLGDKLVLEGSLIAINSNFTHRCQPGFEMYLKPVIKLNKKKEEFTKKRQGQGDGTCFNSSIEMIISLDDNPTPSDQKIYKVKLFPTTGNVQIPGVFEQDLSDGLAVLEKTAFILNKNKIGDKETGELIGKETDELIDELISKETDELIGKETDELIDELIGKETDELIGKETDELIGNLIDNKDLIDELIDNLIDNKDLIDELIKYDTFVNVEKHLQIKIKSYYPIMINYKFRINRSNERLLINLKSLSKYFQILEEFQICELSQINETHIKRFEQWDLILPPYTIRETKPPSSDIKVSFKFNININNSTKSKHPRINFFQEGKINILGVNSIENAKNIYNFFNKLFSSEKNWKTFICIIPRPDNIFITSKVRKPRTKTLKS